MPESRFRNSGRVANSLNLSTSLRATPIHLGRSPQPQSKSCSNSLCVSQLPWQTAVSELRDLSTRPRNSDGLSKSAGYSADIRFAGFVGGLRRAIGEPADE